MPQQSYVIEDEPSAQDVRILEGAAETEAKARGCRRATLDTYSFQAPAFYQRLGYKIVAAVDDLPAGHKHYTLVKDL